MGLSEEEAYNILELPQNSPFHAVLKSYKRLSLYWFPDKHDFSPTSLENFQKISLAIMKLSFPEKDICFSLGVTDMLLLFQQIFFEADTCNCCDTDSALCKKTTKKSDKSADKHQNQDEHPVSLIDQNVTHDERKQTKKAEKRKAEKKRKRARKKLEKASRNQKNEADVLSTSSKTSIERHDVDDGSGTSCDEDDFYYGSDFDYLVADDDDDVESDDCFDRSSFLGYLFHEIGTRVAKQADKNAHALIVEEEGKKKQVEQRKAQKKKRKEKRRLEKVSEVKGENEDKEGKGSPTTKSIDMDDKENLSDFEEAIDLSSAFVAGIAKKKKRQLNLKTLPESSSKGKQCSNQVKVTREKSVPGDGSKQFAVRGNEMANSGNFQEAACLFTEAIKLDVSDHRYYGNRSFCYERLGQYKRALKDAEIAIDLSPKWAKGHFRKGKALVGLKEYVEAENCFEEVLLLDPDCEDATTEIFNTRVLQVMEKGFSKEQAETAIERSGSVHSASDLLLSEDFSKIQMNNEVDVFISDCDSDSDWMIASSNSGLTARHGETPDGLHDPKSQTSLWIGNVQPETTEELLLSLFSQYGEIKDVKMMPEKFYAFINYNDRTAAYKAMEALQGMELHGANLKIRFPKKAKETVQEECYFWRTTGCVYPNSCRFKHVKANKGIDKHGPRLRSS